MEEDKCIITGSIDLERGLLVDIARKEVESQMKEYQLAFEKEKFDKMLKIQCVKLACKTGIKAYEVMDYARAFLKFVEGK